VWIMSTWTPRNSCKIATVVLMMIVIAMYVELEESSTRDLNCHIPWPTIVTCTTTIPTFSSEVDPPLTMPG